LPIKYIYNLTLEKQVVWYILAQLKSNGPIYKSVIVRRFGQGHLNRLPELMRDYLAWGVLKETGDKIEITAEYHYVLEWMLLELIASIK